MIIVVEFGLRRVANLAHFDDFEEEVEVRDVSIASTCPLGGENGS